MPIETTQHALHLRAKKNAAVFRNIDRLWDIGKNSHSAPQILAKLYPWGSPNALKFSNALPLFFVFIGLLCLFLFLFNPTIIWMQMLFILAFSCFFISYLTYEPQKPITDVIQYLEQQIISKKYNLDAQHQPEYLGRRFHPLLFISQLKQQFPLFQQGTQNNTFPFYSSTVWQDEKGAKHHVLLFQYHLTHTQSRPNSKYRLATETDQNLWGFFVFNIQHDWPTFAATTSQKTFTAPYHTAWKSSDIQLSQRVNISGSDQLELAKKLTPAFSLKLAQFFSQEKGDLLFNKENNMLCFLGPINFMEIKKSEQQKNIQDVSSLRRHLRTFQLPFLERLQRNLIHLLK